MSANVLQRSFLGRRNRQVPVSVSSHILSRNCWRSFDAVCFIFQGDRGCSLHLSPCISIIPVITCRKIYNPESLKPNLSQVLKQAILLGYLCRYCCKLSKLTVGPTAWPLENSRTPSSHSAACPLPPSNLTVSFEP